MWSQARLARNTSSFLSAVKVPTVLAEGLSLVPSTPKTPCKVQGSRGLPCRFAPLQTKMTSKILENGEETPGLGPSLNRVLSSSSSVSSLNSSTVKN